MSWWHRSCRPAKCLVSVCKQETLPGVSRVVNTSYRQSHYRPRYITLEERPPEEQSRIIRARVEDAAGPEMVSFPNPYIGLSGKVSPLSDHRGIVKTLDRIVTVDLDKIFGHRLGRPRPPRFMLASDEQLDVLEEAVLDRAMDLLDRPPIHLLREDIAKEDIHIRSDPEMAGFTASKVVITNVDNDLKEDERQIYVRQLNGDLEHADYDVRDRINLTYFRNIDRRIIPEPVFHPVTLQRVLDAGRHKEMLDRIYLQFRPDTAEYINLMEQVYEDVYSRKCYEVVDSTCHFGNLVYYLCIEGRWQGIYDYFKSKNRVSQAADVYRLGVLFSKSEKERQLLADYLVAFEDILHAEKVMMDRELIIEVERRLRESAEQLVPADEKGDGGEDTTTTTV